MTNTNQKLRNRENQRAFRARMRDRGLKEIRGIWVLDAEVELVKNFLRSTRQLNGRTGEGWEIK